MENNFKAKDVFFKALKRNKTNEYDISPYLKIKFLAICEEMVNQNPNTSLKLLYESATLIFRMIRDNPDLDYPIVTFE